MIFRSALIFFIFLFCGISYAQIKAPATIPAGQLVPIEIEGTPKQCVIIVRAIGKDETVPTFEIVAPKKTFIFTATGPAYYIVDVVTADENDKLSHFFTKIFIQGENDVGPAPTPTPTPTPNPVGPAPIPLDGFRVLMIFESEDASKISNKQRNIFYSVQLRDYLNTKCVKGPDNKTPEWRVVDPDSEYSADEQRWKTASSRPRTSLPWLIISDGKRGYEGPLPEDLDKTLQLLKQYGGE